jgi:hypothetical protein
MGHVHGIQGKKLVSRDLPSVNKGLGADNGDNDHWTTTPLFGHQLINYRHQHFLSRPQNARMMFSRGLVNEIELNAMDSAYVRRSMDTGILLYIATYDARIHLDSR